MPDNADYVHRQPMRPTWIAPGMVMCASCGTVTEFREADDHWLWREPDVWTCPACEARDA